MIFVTGSTGLLGAHLLYQLISSGKQVKAMCRQSSTTASVESIFRLLDANGENLFRKIEWVTGDVTDLVSLEEHMTGCDEVYHLAAVVSYHRKDRKNMYAINVGGTANVVNTAIELGIKKLCHVSSIASFGREYNHQNITESSLWTDEKLHTHYGITKHLSEMEVWRGVQEGLNAVIVNPGFIVGPGSFDRSSASVFKKINQGLPFYPPGGTGMVSVTDVAKSMVQLMDSEISGEQFIVVSENTSFKDLFVGISKSLGKKEPNKVAPLWLLHVLRIGEWITEIFTGRKAIVTKESLKNSSLVFFYDNNKIRNRLNFEFEPLSKSVEETSNYFKKNKSNSLS